MYRIVSCRSMAQEERKRERPARPHSEVSMYVGYPSSSGSIPILRSPSQDMYRVECQSSGSNEAIRSSREVSISPYPSNAKQPSSVSRSLASALPITAATPSPVGIVRRSPVTLAPTAGKTRLPRTWLSGAYRCPRSRNPIVFMASSPVSPPGGRPDSPVPL